MLLRMSKTQRGEKEDVVKPMRTEAWQCGHCAALYRESGHASKCCTCSECGGGNVTMLGLRGAICRQCAAKKELAAAEENLMHAEGRLARARANKNGVM